jgi:hypothetical protein
MSPQTTNAALIDRALTQDLLTPRQAERLETLAPLINITPVETKVDGETRLVLIMGETHVKTSTRSKNEMALIRSFDFRGLEGVQLRNENIVGRVALYLVHGLYSMLELIPGMEKSSIRKAKSAGLFYSNGKLSECFGRKSGTSFDSLGQGKYPWLVEGLPVSLALEDNHQPSKSEKGANAYLCLLFSLQVVATFLASIHASEAINILGKFSVLVNVYSITGLVLAVIQRGRPVPTWLLDFFVFPNGLITGRNETMVQNIKKGFRDFPQRKVMVVIVGIAHSSGMKALLEKE